MSFVPKSEFLAEQYYASRNGNKPVPDLDNQSGIITAQEQNHVGDVSVVWLRRKIGVWHSLFELLRPALFPVSGLENPKTKV